LARAVALTVAHLSCACDRSDNFQELQRVFAIVCTPACTSALLNFVAEAGHFSHMGIRLLRVFLLAAPDQYWRACGKDLQLEQVLLGLLRSRDCSTMVRFQAVAFLDLSLRTKCHHLNAEFKVRTTTASILECKSCSGQRPGSRKVAEVIAGRTGAGVRTLLSLLTATDSPALQLDVLRVLSRLSCSGAPTVIKALHAAGTADVCKQMLRALSASAAAASSMRTQRLSKHCMSILKVLEMTGTSR
jgi:hypothetical protein